MRTFFEATCSQLHAFDKYITGLSAYAEVRDMQKGGVGTTQSTVLQLTEKMTVPITDKNFMKTKLQSALQTPLS